MSIDSASSLKPSPQDRRPRVKICGLTSTADALAAVDAGADAVGFMFHPASPRAISPASAGEIAGALPPFVARVGVFVHAGLEIILRTASQCGLSAIQLHGDYPPEFAASLQPWAVIQAFRVRGPEILESLPSYATAAWLLDAFVPGQPGGTGTCFDWQWAAAAVHLGRPVILAGGLTPDNVARAIAEVHPYAVDVSSGVESAPGRKDPVRMRAFVNAVRGA